MLITWRHVSYYRKARQFMFTDCAKVHGLSIAELAVTTIFNNSITKLNWGQDIGYNHARRQRMFTDCVWKV